MTDDATNSSDPVASVTIDAQAARKLLEHFARIGIACLPKSMPLPAIPGVTPTGNAIPGMTPIGIASPDAPESMPQGPDVARPVPPGPVPPGPVPSRPPGPPSRLGQTAAASAPLAPTAPPAPTAPRAPTATPHPPMTDRFLPLHYEGPSLPVTDRIAKLEALAAEVASCQRCPQLACSRHTTVFGEGKPDAKICFFGEAPGQEEDATGRPFVGASGQLLTRMIEACTLRREDVYILNTLKCRPPNNRTPDLTERENCRPFYEEQLRVIRPDYIVCLGLVAAQTLLSTPLSVGRLRKQFYRYHDSKVLVTYHPSYLLRTPAAKAEAWADLKMLMADMGIDLNRR